jgi:hypothetical protein
VAPRKLTPLRRGHQPLDEDSMAAHDAEFAHDDPWRTVRRALNVISLDAAGGDVKDPGNPDDELGSQEPDRAAAIAALGENFDNVLTKQERFVLTQRLVMGDTYATIAETSWPRLSGPSQAKKIEQRAIRKMGERLSRFRKHLTPKLDKSDL